MQMVKGFGEKLTKGIQFKQSEVIEFGVFGAGADEGFHGGTELGFSDVPDVFDEHADALRVGDVGCGCAQEELGDLDEIEL